MNIQEINSIINMKAFERYKYFLNRITDSEEIWGLRDTNGWCLFFDNDGNECMPIWPHSYYAEQCATSEFRNAKPAIINLDYWLEKWIPGLATDKKSITVFPLCKDSENNQGMVIEADKLRKDILIYLDNY